METGPKRSRAGEGAGPLKKIYFFTLRAKDGQYSFNGMVDWPMTVQSGGRTALEHGMTQVGQTERVGAPQGWKILAAAACLLGVLAAPVAAMTVILDIGWGYNATADMTETDLIADYALQEGSIVQVIMYNSADYPSTSFQAGDPAANFDPFGTYGGADIPGQPNVAPWDQAPDTTDVYDPESAPDGHVIAYTTQIGTPVGGNANGYNWYNIYASFQILGTYDSMYIRVFGTTAFPDGSVGASYWGISSVLVSGAVLQTWFATYDDVTATNNVNYFEVIPEPGSLALFALGGIGLWAARRRRPKRI